MNTKNITAWIAQNKGKAALIALGLAVFVWDWFAVPRLIMALLLPLVIVSIPLLIIGVPVAAVVIYFRRRASKNTPETIDLDALQAQGQTHPQGAPQRRLTEQEIMDMYERYPERFEGVDLGDEIDRA